MTMEIKVQIHDSNNLKGVKEMTQNLVKTKHNHQEKAFCHKVAGLISD
jgi:hypothetical protein